MMCHQGLLQSKPFPLNKNFVNIECPQTGQVRVSDKFILYPSVFIELTFVWVCVCVSFLKFHAKIDFSEVTWKKITNDPRRYHGVVNGQWTRVLTPFDLRTF